MVPPARSGVPMERSGLTLCNAKLSVRTMASTSNPAARQGLLRLLGHVDRILRQITGPSAQAGAQTETGSRPSLRELVTTAIGCAAFYGVMMGLYAVSMRGTEGLYQLAASTAKVPVLFAMTVVVTFPSFYVLAIVRGVPLVASELIRVQIVGLTIATTLLASLGPIVAFFTLSTESHAFLLILNVAFFLTAGILGTKSIWSKGIEVIERPARARPPVAQRPQVFPVQGPQLPDQAGDEAVTEPVPPLGGSTMLRAWFVIAFVVAIQSAWILRPLIGRPGDGFTLFEAREENAVTGFLQLVFESLKTPV